MTGSQLNLLHETKKTGVMNKTKNKHRDADKKWSGNEVCGVSPGAGRESESVVGKICERS